MERRAGRDGTKGIDLLRLAALSIAALILLPLIGRAGIWDPYELDSAELARRIAVNVWRAEELRLPTASNALPTLTDLKMGELPFTSMALGFKLLGLHDWTGRLPLALWGFWGAAILYELVARFVSRKAGLYAAVALVTMPLYFIQARTMLGDIVTMAALAMAFSGLLGAIFDQGAAARIAWAGIGAVGLLAGFFARGVLLGVAVPALSVGLTWVVLRAGGGYVEDPRASPKELKLNSILKDVAGASALLLGIGAAGFGLLVLARTSPEAPLPRVLGFALVKKAATEATFDLPIRQIGHALFPWSAFLPFAFGRLFRAPVEAPPAARERETALRAGLIIGASVALAALAFLAPRAGQRPYPAVALLAAAAAVAIVDFERGAPPSRTIALGSLLLAFVLYRDMVSEPQRALSAFVVDRPTFPKSFEAPSASLMRAAAAVFASLTFLAWFEAQPEGRRKRLADQVRERIDEYKAILAELGKVWNGNLAFGAIVVEAALIGLGAMIYVGMRLRWGPVIKLPKNFISYGLNLWWAAPIAAALALPGFDAARGLYRTFVERTRFPRAAGTVLAALLAGGALRLVYYPALAAQLSPKEVFDSYSRLRGASEPLALLGVRSRAATYYQGGGEVESFSDVGRAFTWLTADMAQRRWMVVKADDLPKLNSLFRKAHGQNVPVLDGRSSQILLVSNKLEGRPNESWLAPILLDGPAKPARPLDAMFEDQLEVIGWEVTDEEGRPQADVVPQTKYHLRTYYRVLKPIPGSWKAFLHIDGYQRRYNGDHAVVEGRYPMTLWQPGDVVVDDHEFQLEPNFTPGDYTVYFGFFTGETRFKVTRGSHHENRVIAGPLRVR